MGIYILDLIADSQRVYSLQRICKGYKPNVPVDFIVTQLGFDDKEVGKAFLTKVGCVLVPNPEGVEEFGELAIDTKESVIDLSKLFTQEKLLL